MDAEVIIHHDDNALRALGYEPILRRSWSGFAALCIVLSSMSVLTSVVGTRLLGPQYNDPKATGIANAVGGISTMPCRGMGTVADGLEAGYQDAITICERSSH